MPDPRDAPVASDTDRCSVLVTGSADGLGFAVAAELVRRGHRVVGHARRHDRADQLRARLPGIAEVVVGDFSSFAGVEAVADAMDGWGSLDAVVHNAALGFREPTRALTVDNRELVLQVNVLAPYMLTMLLSPVARYVWMSSRLHLEGKAELDDVEWEHRAWDPYQAYCDSKLFDATLSAALARRWPEVVSNAVNPGWVPTRMGGREASGDLSRAHLTQVWLAEGIESDALRSGGYYFQQRPAPVHTAVQNTRFQDELLDMCARLTGVRPRASRPR